MVMKSISPKIVFISPFTPEHSPVSGFTRDLLDALTVHPDSDYLYEVCAVVNGEPDYIFQPPVSMIMDGNDLNSCNSTARRIVNDPSIKLLCVEYSHKHFGIQGNRHLVEFLEKAGKPYLIRIHDLYAEPSEEIYSSFLPLLESAEQVIVMTRQMAFLITDSYPTD